MSRKKTFSGRKKLALLVGAAALAGGTAVIMTGTSQASVVCDGLATAVTNNENFIAAQRAAPDAQSEARIANRVAVIEEIGRKQVASGCAPGNGGGSGGGSEAGAGAGSGDEGAGAGTGNEQAGTDSPGTGTGTGTGGDASAPDDGNATGGSDATGDVVCAGSTVTLSGEAGPPAASSNQFPVGTTLRVTNLDNNKSTTVQVTSASGSCALLNDAAFELVREEGKFLIRNARIEQIQGVRSAEREQRERVESVG
ncbi:RlpA-like double-psi beta-barrel domain-containing protein [Streptomyces corynorhini]|uniref:Secreted protein n=1 Tax=Streptomyces corynorhini TaxID=2282652 RepID=A0A370AYK9_9ACTN|nr:hypothetical protein [Streptomyces corynorhini]RDG32844.1 hypothetical protein DVH02_31915 [Streptomyces corynorhini]